MYPSEQKPYAGIFVKNQYEELRRILGEGNVDIFFMKREFTSKIGSVLKYLKTGLRFIPVLFRKYEVLHLHFFYPLIYLVWVYKKCHPSAKVVVTFHGRDITNLVNDNNKKRLRKVAKIVDFTIPVGKEISRILEEKLQLKTGEILPVGVNNNIFYKENQTNKYDFIWIGSFIHRKGMDVVIETLKKLKGGEIKFCFCGSGPFLEELKALQGTHNITIKQNQTQDELRTLLNQSKFFFLMSRSEGFPTATIEAMYCGIPILTSDIPQFKEQVVEGKNGYMVPLEDPDALKEALLRLIKLPQEQYEELSNGALESFRTLSLNSICDQLVHIYKTIVQ